MRGLAFSLLVHAGIIVGGMIYLPRMVQVLDTPPIVPVELVTLSDMTSVRASAPELEEIEEEAVEEETIEDEIIDPAPVVEPEPVIEPEVEFIDTEPEIEPEAEPVVVEEEPEPEPEPEPVRPVPQPIVQPRVEAPAEPSLADLLGDLEREVADARSEAGTPDEGVQRRAVGVGDVNTATLSVLVNQHLETCWRDSIDAPNPEELSVPIELTLNRDGTLSGPPRIVDQNRYLNSPNPYMRVASERALRAAVACQPYPLPPENYNEWRQITATFIPRS